MSVIFDAAHSARAAPVRIVMLPAAYARAEDFVRQGFIGSVRERRLEVDLAFADFELQQLTDGTALARLWRELIVPARALGVSVWLGGISLGAYLALCCAARHPSQLAGLCLLAPYLGTRLVTAEIERAGDTDAWGAGELSEDDHERDVWRFIATLRAGTLPVYLGLGREDRFAARQQLLSRALAPGCIDLIAGAHEWSTWGTLWERFLDARLVAGGAGA